MRQPEYIPDLAWAEGRVEAFLDGELSGEERVRFEHALASNPHLEAELVLAQRIQDELRLLPQLVCPPYVTQAVLAEAARREQQAWLVRARRWFEATWHETWRPALAMAVLLLVVVGSSLFGRLTQQPDRAEVQQALEEVKWALAYLSEVGRQAGRSVKEDVLEARVVVPVQHALGTVLEESKDSDNDKP